MKKLVPVLALSFTTLVFSQGSKIPTPESEFGFQPGADYKLANYEQVIGYFQKVDALSDKMMMVQAGKTSQGRVYQFAVISSKSNLSRIDRYLEIARRLAHPDGLTDEEARRLARDGKAIVHIDGGLHASEIAGPQQTPQLLYDLLMRADQPEYAQVFDNVIFMLWPTINPDGMTMVTDWYMSHVTPPAAEGQPQAPAPGLPTLYQEYVGHDNNRDAYMLNMIESRVMEHTWRQWEPNIVYVMHQAPPNPYRIWLPPFAEPIATHAPPIPSSQVNMIGMAIAKGLSEHRQPGAVHMLSTYDAWYPGYIDYNPIFKNIPSFWTETAGASANPGRVGSVTPDLLSPHALYVDPFPGGEWHLRDAVAYDETAALSVLQFAAKYKEDLLYGRYQSGRDQIRKGRSEAPYAYAIPQNQRDPVAPVEMLRRLAFSGVRVYQLSSPVTMTERRGTLDFPVEYAAGTWVVPTDQEFAALAREVLDVQKYPDVRESPNGPLDQPYDAAGWTLPLQMGVRVGTVVRPLTPDIRSKMRLLGTLPDPKAKPTTYNLGDDADASALDSVPGVGFNSNAAAAAIVPRDGQIIGSGTALAVDPAELNAFRALNRAWKAGLEVQYAPASTGGRYLINGLGEQDQTELVKSLALSAQRVSPNGVPMKKPRIAVLNAPSSMDEGWTRWVLERYGFDFVRLPSTDIGAGNLHDKIDVLILADDGRIGGGGGRGGGRGGGGGAAGGAGAGPTTEARVAAVDAFIKDGGTLVCFNRSSNGAIDDLHLPVKNALTGLTRTQLFVGGSVLQITTDPTQRVMAGMPEQAAVFFDSGPAFETLEGFKGSVLAKYQTDGTPLLSGYLLGEKYLQGKAAALDVELGNGHVVLLGFRPQWRGQPFGTFRIVFNAAIYAR